MHWLAPSRVGMRERHASALACDHPTTAAQQPPLLRSTRALHGTLRVGKQKGTWCSGITSASHAEGPGFKSQCVHVGRHGPAFVRAVIGADAGRCCAPLAKGAGTVHSFARRIYSRMVAVARRFKEDLGNILRLRGVSACFRMERSHIE